MNSPSLPNPLHQNLIQRRAQMLASTIRLILTTAPETTTIWCYGINALQPQKPTNDWDFIAFVDDNTHDERLRELNHLAGPLSTLRQIGTQSLDVQAMRLSDCSPCARLIRAEGFCIWHICSNHQQAA